MQIKIKKVNPDAVVPDYAHTGDAGMDLRSTEDRLIRVGAIEKIPTGLSFEIPDGYAGIIWGKSGLATNHGITSLGGVNDSCYRGEVFVTLTNLGKEDYKVLKGQKIAQMLIQPVVRASIVLVGTDEELSKTDRGENGHGSTGVL